MHDPRLTQSDSGDADSGVRVESQPSSTPQTFGEPDAYFFHYTTADAAFGHIVPSGQIRMRPVPLMRDPMEAKDWHFTTDGAGLAHVAPAIEGALNGLRARTTLLSLAVDADGGQGVDLAPFLRGYARPRMWEQYAENHAGVCMCFDRRRFESLAVRHLRTSRIVTHGPVRYTAGGLATSPVHVLPISRFAEDLARVTQDALLRVAALGRLPSEEEQEAIAGQSVELLVEAVTEATVAHVIDHLGDLLLLKTDDWMSEHEYRFVAMWEDEGYQFLPYADTLSAILLGERFPEWQVPGAERRCQQAGVELLRMEWRHGVPTPVPHAAAPD